MHNISIFFTKTFDKICLMRQFIVKWNAKSGRNRLRLKHGQDSVPDLAGPKQSKSKERSNIITHTVSIWEPGRAITGLYHEITPTCYRRLISENFNFYLSTANIRRREKYSVSLTSKLCARKMSRGAITFHIWNF